MKKLFVMLVLFSVPAAFFFGCKHEPDLDDHEVSFSQEVLPILQLNCTQSGCHGDSLNQMPRLTDYDGVMNLGEIKPGKPYDSELYKRLISEDDNERMPRPPYNPITDRNRKLIYMWIAQGAKNN